ncbi:Fe-S cluster assembly protein SufD [Bartonella sp. CB175]|uniref:Fe-S cluster assembly protein SufD n=1 Tax=Bartonella sp. CB175 TaxID=3112256 RepID=UPI00300E0649
MRMNSQRKFIEVETDIINNFNRCIDTLPGNEAVRTIRKEAIELFKKAQLPSRKIENWHYTNLRVLLKTICDFLETNNSELVDALLPDNSIFSIENGRTVIKSEISNVSAESFADALKKNCVKIVPVTVDEDFIGQLNTAFVTDGWIIQILENTKLNTPIEIQNIQRGGQSHTFSEIKIGQNSQATIIEREIGNDKDTFVSSIFSLDVADRSDVTWILIRDRGINSTQFSRLHATLGENAKLSLYIINIGSQLNRQEIDVELQKEESNFQLRTINLLFGKTHSDLTMTVRHIAEGSTSTEIVRNVITDEAHGVFQGMIRVAQKAQKTDARMACNSLILSDDAEFNAKPELEIFADDVACGHGATVAKINRDQLFYLMARGIPFKTAQEILIKGFVSELIDDIQQDKIKTILDDVIVQWLKKNI